MVGTVRKLLWFRSISNRVN